MVRGVVIAEVIVDKVTRVFAFNQHLFAQAKIARGGAYLKDISTFFQKVFVRCQIIDTQVILIDIDCHSLRLVRFKSYFGKTP